MTFTYPRFWYSFEKFLSCRFVVGTFLPTVLIDDSLFMFQYLGKVFVTSSKSLLITHSQTELRVFKTAIFSLFCSYSTYGRVSSKVFFQWDHQPLTIGLRCRRFSTFRDLILSGYAHYDSWTPHNLSMEFLHLAPIYCPWAAISVS